MTATFLGGVSVGAVSPGLSSAYTQVLEAIVTAQAALLTQTQALAAAYQAIRTAAVSSLELELQANVDVRANLNFQLTDPAGYFAGLLAALAGVEAALLAIPVPQMGTDILEQIANALAVAEQLQFQIDAIDLQLDLLNQISAALNQIIALLQQSITPGISGALVTVGAYSFVYTGPLQDFASEAAAVLPAAGVSPTANVLMPFFFVGIGTPADTAVRLLYRT